MLRITQIIEATTGGTRRHLRELIMGIPQDLFDISLICSNKRDQGFSDDLNLFRDNGITPCIIDMQRSPNPMHDTTALARITKLLKQQKPDLVHTHSAKAGFLGRIAASKLNIPTIHTPHVFPFEMKTGHLKHSLYLLLERIAARKTGMLISVSRHGEEIAREAFGRYMPPCVVIHNGLNPELEPATPPLQDDAPPVIGLRSRLCKQKGEDIAISAMAILLKTMPDAKLIIQGEGDPTPLKKLAEQLAISKQIEFLPPDNNPANILSRVTTLIHPSRWEGCPYTILEAMAAKRTVIASSVGGVPEIIRHNETGILTPPENPATLAEAIESVLTSPQMRKRITDSAAIFLRKHLSLDTMLNATINAYNKLTINT